MVGGLDEVRQAVTLARILRALGVAAIVGAAPSACRDVQGKAPPAEDTSYRLRPGYVVDSVRPVEVELQSFRANLGAPPRGLSGGATSFVSLLAVFSRAVEANDSSALKRMEISAAEFAWLVYPTSPFTRPPFTESPRMVWYQLRVSGQVGLERLLKRRGGSPLRIIGHQCDAAPLLEGENKLWRHCVVQTVGAARDTLSERLFGVIVERQGHFKFASYQNQY